MGMFKVAPFTTAVEALEIISEMAVIEYEKQLKDGVEFVVNKKDLELILQLLIQAMNEGITLSKFKKALKLSEITLEKDLPETLFRTIIMGCYQYGHWQSFQQSKRVMPYLMYSAINDSRVRGNHIQLDNIIRPVDDQFWKTNYPPNGINCRCNCILLTEKKAQERSEDNQGLNKFITCKMKPDEGWDFNIGEDLEAFVKVGVVGLVRKDAVYSAC